MAAGAWAGVKTMTPTAAPRFSLASRSSSRMARSDIGRSFASMTTRTSWPRVSAGSRVRTKSPFLDLMTAPVSAAVRSSRSPAPTALPSAEQLLEEVLEVAALGGALRALLGAGGRGGLERGDALVELGEALGDLAAELEERRAQAGGVEEGGELAAVAVDVRAEERLDAADGAVALRLVEELVGERAELAAVAQEGLERAREAPVAVGEVLAQELVEGGGRLGVRLLGLAQEAGELGPDGVDVDGHAGIHEGGHADLEGALDEAGALLGGALGDEGGQAGIEEDQALDDDAVALDRDARGAAAGALAGAATGGRLVADEPGMGGRPAGEGRLTTLAGASMPRTLGAGCAS